MLTIHSSVTVVYAGLLLFLNSLSIQSAYCLEPSKVYRTAITAQSLYTNCTAIKSYSCFSKSNSCPTEFVCRDTASSFACTCADGFSLAHTGQCYDEDECQLGLANCEHQCNNTVGSYECYCNTGYQLSADDRTCEDVDECALGIDQCLNSETCINLIGSYACRETGCVKSCEYPHDNFCICCDGYRLLNRSQCVDVDECQESTDTCDMYCHNIKGSYQCSCDIGFQLVNETKCLDVDECLINNGGCAGLCLNTNGSFNCLSINLSSVKSCECNESGLPSSCSDPANSTCGCCAGYHKSTNSVCVDIDECLESSHVCDMRCNNTKGSYQCFCNEGYQLVDGNKCLDIDECLINNGGCQGICMNSNGSFYCLSIDIATIESYECNEFGYPKSCTVEEDPSCSCCTGYKMQNNSVCVDIDECEESTHLCEMKCQNTKGSYKCSCDQGYQLIHQNKCLDIDECLLNNGGCQGTCLNSNGSFSCLSYNITTDTVSIPNTSTVVNSYLLVILVILVLLIIALVVVFSIIFVFMRGLIKKNSYQAVFQPYPIERDGVYEVPSQDVRESAMLLEKVNTADDNSDNSVELYPAPIAKIQTAD